MVASDVKLTLMEIYPDEHPVKLVHAAGTAQEIVESLPLFEIDRSEHIGLLTVLYVPPLGLRHLSKLFKKSLLICAPRMAAPGIGNRTIDRCDLIFWKKLTKC